MKKRLGPLRLHRETLLQLDAARLGRAAGGGSARACEENQDTGNCGDPVYTGPFYFSCNSCSVNCTLEC